MMKKRIFLILAIACCIIMGFTGCKKNKSQKKQEKDVNGFENSIIKVYKGKYYAIDSKVLYEINLEKFTKKEIAKLKIGEAYIYDWDIQNSKIYYITYTVGAGDNGLEKAKVYVYDMKNKENKRIADVGDCIHISMDNGYIFTESKDADESIYIKKYNLKKETEKIIYEGYEYIEELAGYDADKIKRGVIKGDSGKQIATDYYVYPRTFFKGHNVYYLYFDGTNHYMYQIDLNKYEKTKKVKRELVFSTKNNYALNIQDMTQNYILYTEYKNVRDLRIHDIEFALGAEINIYDIKNKKNIKYTTKYPNKEEVVNWTSDEVITSYSVNENESYLIKYDSKHKNGIILLKDKDESNVVSYIKEYCNGKCIESTSLFNVSSDLKKNEEELQKFLVSDDALEGTWECKELKMKLVFKKGGKVILNGKEFNYTYPRQEQKETKEDEQSMANLLRIYSKGKNSSIKVKQDIVVTHHVKYSLVVVINDKMYIFDKAK